MPWKTNVSGRVSALWHSLQGAGRRGRSVCRPQTGTINPCDVGSAAGDVREHGPMEPRLLGRIKHAAHSQPAAPGEHPPGLPERQMRRVSRGRSRSPEAEPWTSSNNNLSPRRHEEAGVGSAAATHAPACGSGPERGRLFRRFCRANFCRHMSVLPGGGLEEVPMDPAVFALRLRREMRPVELFPNSFHATFAGKAGALGPGLVVVETEQHVASNEQALLRLLSSVDQMGKMSSTPIAAVLVTSVSKDGINIVDMQQVYEHLSAKFSNSFPGMPLLFACAEFDEGTCAEREASLLGRGRGSSASLHGSEIGEERGRTLSRGSRSRRSHAPARRVVSREPHGAPAAFPDATVGRSGSCFSPVAPEQNRV